MFKNTYDYFVLIADILSHSGYAYMQIVQVDGSSNIDLYGGLGGL